MKIDLVPIASITPYVRNPRKTAAAVATVRASLVEFGWQQPIVVDGDGVIIVGHTRYLAAMELGWAEVPVHVATDLTPAQAKAYRIMDNKSHELATWDLELLPLELEELKGLEFPMELTGFGMFNLPSSFSDEKELESSAKELDPDGYQLGHKCPRCGFEFDEKA